MKVIYDAAHGFGVRFDGQSLLSYGDASTLSFHATKLFHTGEGGGIVCQDKAAAEVIYYHHNFGHRGEEGFWGLGINGKMSELNAAMGLSLLPYIDQIISKRKEACKFYDDLLSGSDLQRIKLRRGAEWNYSYYPVVFRSDDDLMRAKNSLNSQQIFPRRYFYPSLNMLPYLPYQEMPIAEDVSKRVLCLPLSADITGEQIEVICKAILERV